MTLTAAERPTTTPAPGRPRTRGAALDALPPVHLDRLVERAALQTRVDRKYLVPVRELPDLLASLPAAVQVLDIDGRREFRYRSTYLDTPAFDSFAGAGRARRRRFKVRTRTYLDTGSSWLEVKTRGTRGVTVKARIEQPDAEDVAGASGLTPQGVAFVRGELAAASLPAYDVAGLRPVLVTAYRRATLFHPVDGSRATVDVDLGWTALDPWRTGAGGDLDRGAVAVVETKTGSTPAAVDRLLWSRGHRPVRMSKYGVGMAALHPWLPRLKWHHVMTRHLGLPRTTSPRTTTTTSKEELS